MRTKNILDLTLLFIKNESISFYISSSWPIIPGIANLKSVCVILNKNVLDLTSLLDKLKIDVNSQYVCLCIYEASESLARTNDRDGSFSLQKRVIRFKFDLEWTLIVLLVSHFHVILFVFYLHFSIWYMFMACFAFKYVDENCIFHFSLHKYFRKI